MYFEHQLHLPLENKQHIIKIKQGSPFQFMAVSFGYLSLVGGIYLAIYVPQTPIIAILAPMLIGLFIIFLRNEFWINTKTQLIRNTRSVFGLKYGKWHHISEFKAVSIKYTILSDKNRGKRAGFAGQLFSLVRYSENQYNKDETWVVNLFTVKNEKFQILNTDKKKALKAVIFLLQAENTITPYLANFRPEFELSKPHILKGQLALLNTKQNNQRR